MKCGTRDIVNGHEKQGGHSGILYWNGECSAGFNSLKRKSSVMKQRSSQERIVDTSTLVESLERRKESFMLIHVMSSWSK